MVCAHMARPRSVHGPRSSSFCCGQGEGERKGKYVIVHKQASNAKKEGGKEHGIPKESEWMSGEAEKGAWTKANETKTKTRPDRYDISFSHRSAKRSKHNCVRQCPSMLVMPDHGYITISVHTLLPLHVGETIVLHRGGSDSSCCSVRIGKILILLALACYYFFQTSRVSTTEPQGRTSKTHGWMEQSGWIVLD